MIHLYSGPKCPFSHRTRIVLNKKDMDFELIDTNVNSQEDLLALNPYNETPVLVDDIDKNNKKKDVILIDPNIICEYIDERFPHPQLMPIEPAEKARLRMIINQFDRELFVHLRILEQNMSLKDSKQKKEFEKSRRKIVAELDHVAQVFVLNKKTEFLFGNTFSLLDANILPLLWRLKYYNIDASKPSWLGMMRYANKIFETKEFIASLTPSEIGMQ